MRYKKTPATYPARCNSFSGEPRNVLRLNRLGAMGLGRVELPTSRLSVSIAQSVNAGQLDSCGVLERTPLGQSGQVMSKCPTPKYTNKYPAKNENGGVSRVQENWTSAKYVWSQTNPARTRRGFPHPIRGKARNALWENDHPYNCRIYHATCRGARHSAGLLRRLGKRPPGPFAKSGNRGRRRLRLPAIFTIGGAA